MLKAAVDVYYGNKRAKAVCMLFDEWHAKEPFRTAVAYIDEVAAYEPGAFYKRELPCILHVLQQVNLSLIEAIVIDGYVFLDDEGKKGLGAHLYEALDKKVPVIGVAKTKFFQNNKKVVKVYRGQSRNPLFVTAIGINPDEAAAALQAMAGQHRMPELIQLLDRKTREVNNQGDL